MPMTLPDWGGAPAKSAAKPTKNVVSKMPKPAPAPAPVKHASKPAPAPSPPKIGRKPMASTSSPNTTLGQNTFGSYSSLPNFNNNFSGFDSSGGGLTAAPEAKKPKPVSEKDWLAEDDIYEQELNALTAALKSAAAQYGSFSDGVKGDWQAGRQERDYDTDFARNLKSLGWQTGADWDPSTYMDNRDSGGDFGSWNQNDRLTSYGSSYNNQLEDFAARGLLDSSAYMQALGDMNRGYSDQLGNIVGDRTSFINNMQDQYRDAYSAYDNDRDQARLMSLQRRAAEFGL